MNFSTTPVPLPKHAVPCLADIRIGEDLRQVYWRAQVGLANGVLIVAALNNPPNEVVNHRPADVSPGHGNETLGDKIAHLFHHDRKAPNPSPVKEFPGIIDGRPLAAITIPVTSIDAKNYVLNNDSSKTSITIPVTAIDPRGQGTIRLEFDNWLSAKAEVDILDAEIRNACHPNQPAAAPAAAAAPPHQPREVSAALGIPYGRDEDGSTHPSGDAPYDKDWVEKW